MKQVIIQEVSTVATIRLPKGVRLWTSISSFTDPEILNKLNIRISRGIYDFINKSKIQEYLKEALSQVTRRESEEDILIDSSVKIEIKRVDHDYIVWTAYIPHQTHTMVDLYEDGVDELKRIFGR